MPTQICDRDRLALCFPATPPEVRRALHQITFWAANRLTPDETGLLETALAEILNNVVEHGYANIAAGQIGLEIDHRGTSLGCRVTDCGGPMPGLAVPAGVLPAIDGAVDTLPEGGFGWALIRHLVGEPLYERRAGANRLCFSMPLAAPQSVA